MEGMKYNSYYCYLNINFILLESKKEIECIIRISNSLKTLREESHKIKQEE